MTLPLLPDHEVPRLEALRSTRMLDTPPEPRFDDLVRVAALVCGAPIALLNLVDAERVWVKARFGTDVTEIPRRDAFCSHAIREPHTPFVVEDLSMDERFRGAASVRGEPQLRFYAGAAIVDPDGHALGTLCVLDRTARKLSSEQLELLRALARQAAQLLELRRALLDTSRLSERVADVERERQRGATRADLLHGLFAEHARTRDPAAIVAGVLERLAQACPGMTAEYSTLSRTGMLEHVAAAHGWSAGEERNVTVDLLDSPEYLAQLRAGVVVAVRDVERESTSMALLAARRARGVRALVEVAIQPGEDTSGVLGLAAKRAHPWWPHEVELLSEAALALETLLWHAEHARRDETLVSELATREERWRRTCDARGIGSVDWCIATDELFVSERGAAILGLAAQDLHTTNAAWCERLHPHDRAAWLALTRSDASGFEAPRTLELRVRGCADEWQVMRASLRIVRDARGDAARVVGSIEPVVRREHARA